MQAFLRNMTNTASYIVQLDQLELGVHTYEFRLDDEWFRSLEKSEITGGETKVKAVLSIGREMSSLRIRVEGTVQLSCDRCLAPMDWETEVEEDIDVEEDEKELDLGWLAYELIATNLPLVHCHPEGACDPEMIALLQQHLCRAAEEPEEN